MVQWMLLRNGLLHCSTANASVASATAVVALPGTAAAGRTRSSVVVSTLFRRFSTVPDRHKRNHFKSNRDYKDNAGARDGNGKAGDGTDRSKAFGNANGRNNAQGGNNKGGGGGGSTQPRKGFQGGRKSNVGRRGAAIGGKDGAVFTNKFQNLLSFALDDDETDAKPSPKTESRSKNQVNTSRPFSLSGQNKGKNEARSAGGAFKRPAVVEEDEDDDDDDDDLELTNDLAITALALDVDDDGDDDGVDALKSKKTKPKSPVNTEDAGKKKLLKHQKKKDGRSLLKNFKFENSIFGDDSELFGHVDWEERGTVNREERRFKRQQRKTEKKPKVVLPPQEVEIPTRITVKDLADRMGVKSKVLIRALRDLGERVDDESVITNDIAEVAVESLNMIPVLLPPEFVDVELTVPPADCSMYPVRPSVISVMGHVDHGKTTLLDALRKSKVAASEAGGITQSIGAFTVELGKKYGTMTFIDTPGHAAFSSMRSMGSEVTDVIVLVVAADDGVRPQTEEVIQLALKNNVPLVVAVTKMDMHAHDQNEVTDRIAGELLKFGVVVESMGGETPLVCVSGKTGEGLDTLKETIALHSEMLDLRADTSVGGEAVVLESKLARGVGPQVDTIVKWGTLKNGTVVVCGLEYGKIRALIGPDGKRLKEATPGTPVRVIGLKGLPNSGEPLLTVPSEERAKEVVQQREEILQWDVLAANEEAEAEASGDEAFPRRRRIVGVRAKSRELEIRRRHAVEEAARLASLKVGEDGYIAKIVPIIVKTDSMGVISAIDDLISALPTDEAVIKRVLGAVGPVSSSDIALAEATGATIYHFNVKHPSGIDQEALQKDVTLKSHNVIYSLLDDITDLLRDNLEGVQETEVTGSAEILQAIPITKSGRRTVNIAGCKVLSGTMNMQAKYRILRDGEVIAEDLTMETMRHFQDKVSEVNKGQECGLLLQDQAGFLPGDILESYITKTVKKGL